MAPVPRRPSGRARRPGCRRGTTGPRPRRRRGRGRPRGPRARAWRAPSFWCVVGGREATSFVTEASRAACRRARRHLPVAWRALDGFISWLYHAGMNEIAPASAAYRLMWALRVVEERFEAALEPLGLSLAKFGCLAKLVAAGEPLPLSTLAERCACVRSNITQLVDRLEADKLVVRADDPHDRRSVRAELTDGGPGAPRGRAAGDREGRATSCSHACRRGKRRGAARAAAGARRRALTFFYGS